MTNSQLRDLEVAVRKCYEVVETSNGNLVGTYEKVILITGEVYWVNLDTDAVTTTAPTAGSGQVLQFCTGDLVDSEIVSLCDVISETEVVKFFRIFTFTIQNGVTTVTTKDVDSSGADYTVVGTEGKCLELIDWTPQMGVATNGSAVTIPKGTVSYSILQLTAGTPEANTIELTGAVTSTIPAEVAEYSEGDEVNESQLSNDIVVTPTGSARAFVAWKIK